MSLINPVPARSLGVFTAPDADGAMRQVEVIAASTGKLAVLRDGKVCEPQADPAAAISLAQRVLAGDTRAFSMDAIKIIATALAAAALEYEQERVRA